MKVLVDTSVWVGHFKQRDEQLVALPQTGLVACHPYVVVEVACGTPAHRRDVIDMLRELDSVPLATADELLALLQRRALFGRRCGTVGLSLLASALLSEQTRLWTLDKRLAAVATELALVYRPALAS